MDLSKVLVVCNFIHPFYKNIPALKSILKVPNIVFYGDRLWSTPPEVIPYNQSDDSATLRNFGGGFFAYRCMLDAIERFQGYSGYLFMMDDVLLFPNRLQKRESDSLLFSLPKMKCDVTNSNPESAGWLWWGHKYGIKAFQESLNMFPRIYLDNLCNKTGSESVVFGQPNDAFYLPEKFTRQFKEVFEIFSKYRVFTEIAIPTGLYMIGNNHQEIGIKYVWGRERKFWLPLTPFMAGVGIHPVKFSSKANQYSARAIMNLVRILG